jgi:hypothetical protein
LFRFFDSITLELNVTLSLISFNIINCNFNDIDHFSESQRAKIALEKMFIPPTENEIKACLKNHDDDNDSIVIHKNNYNDDSSIKYSNVINGENAKFQENKTGSNSFIHYKHESNTTKDKTSPFECKKNENQSSFCNNIENGETKVSVQENGIITKLNFWNFRSIFQTKKVSFPVQRGTRESIESKIMHLFCHYDFILYFMNFLDYHFTLHFVSSNFDFLSFYIFIDTQVDDYSYIYMLFFHYLNL